MMKKVFISSKQGELDPERAALHQALQSPEWDNFTIEFSGAFPDSVRDVFLKNVPECDVYLGIFASIYSQPTVDEYYKAKELRKPILIYLKNSVNRDKQLQDFIRAELQPSHKYQEFFTTDELVEHLPDIRRALDVEVQKHQRQVYLDALVAQTELLELAGIVDTGEQERPKLQEIFVALSAAEEVEERDERQPKDKRERERPIKIIRRVTINEALREHRALMILGDPGAGKSTLLRYLTLVVAQGDEGAKRASSLPESCLPILIRLSSFAQSGQSFIEYFETYVEKQLGLLLGKQFFERALEDGQAIVCLDGLDEVSQPAQRIEVRNAITALAARYPRNLIIVTSRVTGYDSTSLDKRIFAHHTILPFGENEIRSLVEKWYAAREREIEQAKILSSNLVNDLKANERLMKLAENPLMLTIIALVHQRVQGKLPDARVELYDRCAETLIEEWDKWKGLASNDRERPYYLLRRRLLERAAYWMHVESQETDVAQIPKHALEVKVAEFLVEDKTLNLSEDTARIEAKQFVALATSRMGILVAREQGAVSFIHMTFQEYFAASDLYWRYRRTPHALWQVTQPHLYDPRWLEIILLLLGRLNNDDDIPSTIVGKILHERDRFDQVLHRNLFLAARCLADRVNVEETLQIAIAKRLIKFAGARKSDRSLLQDDAIETLGTLHANKHARDALLGWMQNRKTDLWVRHQTILAIGKVRASDDVFINTLLALAKDKQEETDLRVDAAQALAQLGWIDEAVEILLGLAGGEIVSSGILDPRANIGRLLGELGRVEEAARILLAMAKDKSVLKGDRREAPAVLGRLGSSDDVIVNTLLAMAKDQEIYEGVRCDAAEELGHLGHIDDAVQILLALVQDQETDEHVRTGAAKVLERLGRADDIILNVLSALAHNNVLDERMRSAFAQALGELGHVDDAVPILLTLAQNESIDVSARTTSALALGQLGYVEDAVPILLVLAQDEKLEDDLRSRAADALGQLGRLQDAVPILLAFAQDGKVDILTRVFATGTLRNLRARDPSVVLGLYKLTQEHEDIIRTVAFDALKEVLGNLRYAELDNRRKLKIKKATRRRQ